MFGLRLEEHQVQLLEQALGRKVKVENDLSGACELLMRGRWPGATLAPAPDCQKAVALLSSFHLWHRLPAAPGTGRPPASPGEDR